MARWLAGSSSREQVRFLAPTDHSHVILVLSWPLHALHVHGDADQTPIHIVSRIEYSRIDFKVICH